MHLSTFSSAWLRSKELPSDTENMTLGQKQREFSFMLSLLLLRAYSLGYEVSLGDAWSKPEYEAHTKDSFHYKRLAIDLNLFMDGEYLESTEDHRPLGEFWKSIGGSWGGDFRDGNHYSLGEI